MKTLEVAARLEQLEKVSRFVMSEVTCPCTDEEKMEISLVVEELFVNIVKYAYDPQLGKAWVSCEYDDKEHELTLVFQDEGVPFNPLTVKNPDVQSDIEHRKIGTLGIYLVKKCMDSIDYAYQGACNVVTLKKVFRQVGGESFGF